MVFYVGCHQPGWMRQTEMPLCVSRRRLASYKRLPEARGPWMLDSGGFTELDQHGRWVTTPAQYVDETRRFMECGHLGAAACQDWMCEPGMLAKTGLSVAEHQKRTVSSYLDLMHRDAALPWFPVLQGWQPSDYLRHVEQYAAAGVDLQALPLVGLGSVCRRQHTGALVAVVSALAPLRLRLHGFGVKRQGLEKIAPWLVSADSMAWSFAARKRAPLPGCTHRSCANCLRYASQWGALVVSELGTRRLTALQGMLDL
jgi:hypothetical protein